MSLKFVKIVPFRLIGSNDPRATYPLAGLVVPFFLPFS